MGKLKLRGKDLRAIGYPEGPVISIAMNIMEKNYKFKEQEDVMNLLKQILTSPVEYANDAVLGLIARQLMPKQEIEGMDIALNQTGVSFNIFGGDQIEHGATHQMYQAAKLPIAVAGQLGSSGSGNHFVEFGMVEITEKDPVLCLEPGQYLGLLSHSGSRALGANIANHYTRIAKQKRRLPGEANNLAWLDLKEEEGIEYWLAMNLGGDYASACHEIIHNKIARQLGRQPLKRVENHHNFAWKEIFEGREVIVHRKGATPAGKDVLGVIPGSMTAPGFIVKGKGLEASLSSASHGAGRRMSRTAALNTVTHDLLKKTLLQHGVKLLGGGLDEAPQAYKDIETVMQSQRQLIDVLGKFTPRIVKMD